MTRRKKGRNKTKSIPVAPMLPIAFVAYQAATKDGTLAEKLAVLSVLSTGYDPRDRQFKYTAALPFWTGEIAALVVHKVANKTINKYIRKATFGYLTL